jgi:hypothetical protein
MSEAIGSIAPSGLVLFLSVDLVGSTAFKAAAKSSEPSPRAPSPQADRYHQWLPVFTGFYYRFPERLAGCLEKESKVAKNINLGKAPAFWKPIGDELVFTKTLHEKTDAFWAIRAFRRAVLEYRDELTQKHPTLGLKATAWLAGFPVANVQIPIGDDAALKEIDLDGEPLLAALQLAQASFQSIRDKSKRVDYLGPSMDVGFRLSKLASTRKFVLSVDLAYLLSDTHQSASDQFEYRYDGRVELKGVLGNKPYPVFWIDMEPTELAKIDDDLLGQRTIKPHEVRALADLFLESTDGKICRPYLVGAEGKVKYGEIPEDHAALLKLMSDAAARDLAREKAAAQADVAGKTLPSEFDKLMTKFREAATQLAAIAFANRQTGLQRPGRPATPVAAKPHAVPAPRDSAKSVPKPPDGMRPTPAPPVAAKPDPPAAPAVAVKMAPSSAPPVGATARRTRPSPKAHSTDRRKR